MDLQLRIADGAAALALLLSAEADLDGDNWPFIGKDHDAGFGADPAAIDAIRVDAVTDLAGFVRAYPTAPGEALYRHASALGYHAAAADGWLAIPPEYRTAYMIFRDTLLSADREAAEEAARRAAREAVERPQPPNYVRQDETIMAQHGHLMERMDDAPVMVNLGGPDVEQHGDGAQESDGVHGDEPASQGAGDAPMGLVAAADTASQPAPDAPADGQGRAADAEVGRVEDAVPLETEGLNDVGGKSQVSAELQHVFGEHFVDAGATETEEASDAELVSEAAMGEASAGSPLPADPEPGAPNHGLSGPADAADLPAEGPDAATASADARHEAEAKALAPARDADKPAGVRRKR